MRCPKCKVVSMYDDPDRMAGIQVYACLTCGNRVYVGYPKRPGGEKQSKSNADAFRKLMVPKENRTVVPFRRASKG
jgi:hypothetical protein